MLCPKCGTEINTEYIQFCPVCGEELDWSEEVNGPTLPQEQYLPDQDSSKADPRDTDPSHTDPYADIPDTGPVDSDPIDAGPVNPDPINVGITDPGPIKPGPGQIHIDPVPPGILIRKLALPIAIIGLVILAFIVIKFINSGSGSDSGTGSKQQYSDESIYLSSYVSVEFTGEEGSGIAIGSFDYLTMIGDYPDVFSLTEQQQDKIKKLVGINPSTSVKDRELLEQLFGNVFESGPVSMSIKPESGLSNNDTVVVSIDSGESTLEDIFPVNFVCDNKTVKVSNLQKAEEPVDLPTVYMAPYVKVKFSGTDGSGTGEISFDYTSMIKAYPEVFRLTDDQKNEIIRVIGSGNTGDSDEKLLEAFFSNSLSKGMLNVQLIPVSDFSNGDKVIASLMSGEVTLKNIFKTDFIWEDVSFTVNGLKAKPTPPPETPTPSPPTPTPPPVEYISLPNGLEAPAEHFLFPYSSQSLLSMDQLNYAFGGMNDADQKYNSQLAIDEIFFRYGWQAKDLDLSTRPEVAQMLEIFKNYGWYQQAIQYYPGDTDWETFKKYYMNDYEKKNINLIVEWQIANVP